MSPSAGDPVYASDIGHGWIAQQRFTSNGSFTKASYPSATKVRVQVQGGGGGAAGSAATSGTQISCAAGGEGGAYAESWLDVSSLASSVTVTVGAGGAGGVGGIGSSGSASSFGTTVTADGGAPGNMLIAAATNTTAVGGSSSQAMTGDIQIGGQGAGPCVRLGTILIPIGSEGGSSFLGQGGACPKNANGGAGRGYGGGGGGNTNDVSQAIRTGGAGAAGIVIVDVYA